MPRILVEKVVVRRIRYPLAGPCRLRARQGRISPNVASPVEPDGLSPIVLPKTYAQVLRRHVRREPRASCAAHDGRLGAIRYTWGPNRSRPSGARKQSDMVDDR